MSTAVEKVSDTELPPSQTSTSANSTTVLQNSRSSISLNKTVVVGGLSLLAGAAAWMLIYCFALTPFQESRQQTVLYGDLRQSLALQTTPIGGTINPGTPVALLSAPALGINDQVVVEGTASGDLMAGPGHRRDTPLPGQIGWSVVYGRGAMFGAPFSGISKATPGATISVTTGQGVFTYQVLDVRRTDDPLPGQMESGSGRLTLVSDEGTGPLKNWHPDGVVYVDAALKEQAQQYPPGRPYTVPTSENAMQGDPSAVLALVLALPLLLVGVMVAMWLRLRWGLWQAWLTGLPLILAGLWLVSTSAVQLLPNLI